MDWSKLSPGEIKEFIKLNSPLSDVEIAQTLFTNRRDNLVVTEPIADLYIATNFTGTIPQKYDPDKIKRLSKRKLKIFGQIFGIEPNADRIIRILGYLGALSDTGNYFSLLAEENYISIALKLDYGDIIRLCQVSPKFNRICTSTSFWRDKAMVDFGVSSEDFTRARETLIPPHSILVDNIDPSWSTSYIKSEMSRFGQIAKIKLIDNFYVVKYRDSRDADAIMSYPDMVSHLHLKKSDAHTPINPRLIYLYLGDENTKKLAKEKVPPTGAGIIVSFNSFQNIGDVEEDFSQFGEIATIIPLSDTLYIVTYLDKEDAKDVISNAGEGTSAILDNYEIKEL